MNRGTKDLYRRIAELARSTTASTDHTSPTEAEFLDEVTVWATKFLPVVDSAGISLVHHHGKRHDFESVAPAGADSEFIDRMQDKFGAGPCIDAIRNRTTVVVDDYRNDRRWPELSSAIVSNTSVRSSLSILLYTDHRRIGALNLYSRHPRSFDTNTIEQAEAIAAHVAVGIYWARRNRQFESALASRDIIGQAKGITMERFGVDALQAFRILSKLSQDRNIPVAELAKQIVEMRHLP